MDDVTECLSSPWIAYVNLISFLELYRKCDSGVSENKKKLLTKKDVNNCKNKNILNNKENRSLIFTNSKL